MSLQTNYLSAFRTLDYNRSEGSYMPTETISLANPITARQKPATMTFAETAKALIQSMSPAWRNAKHRAQWTMTLTVYCAPIAGLPVSEIATDHVLRVLRPLWLTKPETASRLRGRIERTLDYAKAKGSRSGENPARWRGHL